MKDLEIIKHKVDSNIDKTEITDINKEANEISTLILEFINLKLAEKQWKVHDLQEYLGDNSTDIVYVLNGNKQVTIETCFMYREVLHILDSSMKELFSYIGNRLTNYNKEVVNFYYVKDNERVKLSSIPVDAIKELRELVKNGTGGGMVSILGNKNTRTNIGLFSNTISGPLMQSIFIEMNKHN